MRIITVGAAYLNQTTEQSRFVFLTVCCKLGGLRCAGVAEVPPLKTFIDQAAANFSASFFQ